MSFPCSCFYFMIHAELPGAQAWALTRRQPTRAPGSLLPGACGCPLRTGLGGEALTISFCWPCGSKAEAALPAAPPFKSQDDFFWGEHVERKKFYLPASGGMSLDFNNMNGKHDLSKRHITH